MPLQLDTIRTALDDGVLSATFDSPPINLIGPELVHDLVHLLDHLAATPEIRVVVFSSADPDFFLPHVDLLKVGEYTAEVARATAPGDAYLGFLFRRLSELPTVSIAKIAGRAGGAGSEFALACDIRFASLERAVFGQLEVGTGAIPGAGAIQHLSRLMGRGRALEVILGSDDFDAATAERYGWINRAVPDAELDAVVDRLAGRIARFPAGSVAAAKIRVNTVTLADPAEVRADAQLFQELARGPELGQRIGALFEQGLQTRSATELRLGAAIGELGPA
jgi:enoyl-CoA hydratase/carnithine racemase